MRAPILAFLVCLESFLCAQGDVLKGKPKPPPRLHLDTVDELIKEKYYGLWYQIAANQAVYDAFEKNNYCVTATYGPNDDGTISVRNYAKIGSPNGMATSIEGYAYTPNLDEPGQLRVHFDESRSPCDGYYWVLGLGPSYTENKYAWSVVSDNRGEFLFVLDRDVKHFNEVYRVDVMEFVATLGFNPIDTYQEDDCVYE